MYELYIVLKIERYIKMLKLRCDALKDCKTYNILMKYRPSFQDCVCLCLLTGSIFVL